MIQDLSGSWCIKGTGESMTRVDSPVPVMRHDPDRSWITDLDPDHPKGTQPKSSSHTDASETQQSGRHFVSNCKRLLTHSSLDYDLDI